jgi:hypothetical protein
MSFSQQCFEHPPSRLEKLRIFKERKWNRLDLQIIIAQLQCRQRNFGGPDCFEPLCPPTANDRHWAAEIESLRMSEPILHEIVPTDAVTAILTAFDTVPLVSRHRAINWSVIQVLYVGTDRSSSGIATILD